MDTSYRWTKYNGKQWWEIQMGQCNLFQRKAIKWVNSKWLFIEYISVSGLVLTACLRGSDIIIALDTSGSIGEDNVNAMVSFLGLLINSLYVEGNDSDPSVSRIGLVSFSDSANMEFHLNTYRERTDLLQAINVQYVGGTTNTSDAIRYTCSRYFHSNIGQFCSPA